MFVSRRPPWRCQNDSRGQQGDSCYPPIIQPCDFAMNLRTQEQDDLAPLPHHHSAALDQGGKETLRILRAQLQYVRSSRKLEPYSRFEMALEIPVHYPTSLPILLLQSLAPASFPRQYQAQLSKSILSLAPGDKEKLLQGKQQRLEVDMGLAALFPRLLTPHRLNTPTHHPAKEQSTRILRFASELSAELGYRWWSNQE